MPILQRIASIASRIVSYLLFISVSIHLTGCVSTSDYNSQQKKQALLAGLSDHIDHSIGGDFGPLIVKLDLLELDSASYQAGTCPISPIAASVYKDNDQSFDERVSAMEQKFNQLLETPETFFKTLTKHTQYRIVQFERLIRQSRLRETELVRASPDHALVLASVFAGEADPRFEGGAFIPWGDSHTPIPKQAELSDQLTYLESVSNLVDSFPLLHPMPHSRVSSDFRIRRDPLNGKLARHEGIDLASTVSASVHSTAGGTVTFAGRSGNYGNLVIIRHGLGLTTRYAHLSEILVQKGEKVGPYQVIGIEGNTGRVTGAHLHYEVRVADAATNPRLFLSLGNKCRL